MSTKMIPPIGTKGLYVLKAPYNVILRANEIYECGAIRYFKDIENTATDVYDMYYKPLGLDQSVYEEDLNNGHVLITLLSAKYPPVYVPSSYIASYPSLDSKQYNQVILTASLGALPDTTILEPTIQALKNTLEGFVGVQVEVHVGILPLTDVVSPAEHETREAARLAAIANSKSDYGRLLEMESLNIELKQKNKLLEQIIKNNNLIN